MKTFITLALVFLLGLTGSIPVLAGETYIPPAILSPVTYTEQQVFDLSGEASNWFGYSVAISGDTAIVGAPLDQVDNNPIQGSAFVYVRQGRTWVLQTRLVDPEGASGDNFGFSVAIDGDTAMVGIPGDQVLNDTTRGSLIVFTRTGNYWSFDRRLVASDGAQGDNFGWSLALSGNELIVGAPFKTISIANQGVGYVFSDAGWGWSQVGEIINPLAKPADHLGWSVAISGDTAICGAPDADLGYIDKGMVFIATGANNWMDGQAISPVEIVADEHFGRSVSTQAGIAAIGVPGKTIGSDQYGQGAVYIYEQTDQQWNFLQMFTAADGAAFDNFGTSLAMQGNRIVVGSPYHRVGSNDYQGAAYTFTSGAAGWVEQAELFASDGFSDDYFAGSVAVSGPTILVGAYLDDVGQNADQGSAYLFTVPGLFMPLVSRATP